MGIFSLLHMKLTNYVFCQLVQQCLEWLWGLSIIRMLTDCMGWW